MHTPSSPRRWRAAAINALTLLISLGASLVVCEIALALLGRYSDVVEKDSVPSERKIFDHTRNSRATRRHPDLPVETLQIYNDVPIREHRALDRSRIAASGRTKIGFFGDSFTENRRIDQILNFPSVLQYGLDRSPANDALVLNFGVDAYGPDQAFVKYSENRDLDLAHVFYVFCANDLRNLYENGILDLDDADGLIEKRHEPEWYVGLLRERRLTYLAMDSYFRVRSWIRSVRHELEGGGRWDADDLAMALHAELVRDLRLRRHDAFADSMARALLEGGGGPRLARYVSIFARLMVRWQESVERRSGTFHVVVLPRSLDTAVARRLLADLPSLDVFYLRDHYLASGGYDYVAHRFVGDEHWNEYGNVAAASALLARYDGVLWQAGPAVREQTEALFRELADRYYSHPGFEGLVADAGFRSLIRDYAPLDLALRGAPGPVPSPR